MSQTEKLETEVEFKYEKPVLVFIFNQEQLFILSEFFFRQCLYVEVTKICLPYLWSAGIKDMNLT